MSLFLIKLEMILLRMEATIIHVCMNIVFNKIAEHALILLKFALSLLHCGLLRQGLLLILHIARIAAHMTICLR